MTLRQLAPVLAIALLAVGQATAVENAVLLRAANTITADELQAHVDVLADDSFEGREAGTRGGQAAAKYLVKQMEKLGLAGAGVDGSFYQPFRNGCRNLLGVLEGSDPELKDEYIVLGAHYDHVGYGRRGNSFGPFGYVHNGADDNASGTAGVLETIDALLALPSRPRRSLLVAFWDGEEQGLWGSKHWTANPTVPLDRLAAMLNLDMIGRLRKRQIKIYGSRTGAGLRRLVSQNNFNPELTLNFDWELKANSDHHPFASKQIPVLMFHTGLHDDYHRPSDDAHTVNSDGMQTTTRLLFHVVHELANRPEAIAFRPECWREGPNRKREFERPLKPMPPRLGVSWADDENATEPGLRITKVTRGSAAAAAGLRPGDRLLTFAGETIKTTDQFRLAVLRASSPVPAKILKQGADQPEEIELTLHGNATRIGFAWREHGADAGTVLLTRVVTGSPAALAGLKLGDRLYEVNGEPFVTGDKLYELLTTLPGPIEVTAERDGQVRAARMDVPPPFTP